MLLQCCNNNNNNIAAIFCAVRGPRHALPARNFSRTRLGGDARINRVREKTPGTLTARSKTLNFLRNAQTRAHVPRTCPIARDRGGKGQGGGGEDREREREREKGTIGDSRARD